MAPKSQGGSAHARVKVNRVRRHRIVHCLPPRLTSIGPRDARCARTIGVVSGALRAWTAVEGAACCRLIAAEPAAEKNLEEWILGMPSMIGEQWSIVARQ